MICLYLFVAIAKVCRQEQLSNLFQTTEVSSRFHQALDLKQSKGSRVWQLNKKSQVLMQDSSFILKKKIKKEKV